MGPKSLPSGYHLSLSISQDLWSDLLGEALPFQVGEGDFDVIEGGRKLIEAAETQVRGLLAPVEEQLNEAPVLGTSAGKSARASVRGLLKAGRNFASRRVKKNVKVMGKWRARVSRDGSQFVYSEEAVTLDARAVLEVEGRALLFGEQFEVPFTITRHVDGSATLGGVNFDRTRKQLEGNLESVSLSLGESLPLRLLKVLGERLIATQVDKVNPLPLIPGSTLQNMLLPGDGPLKVSAGIEDLYVGISDQDLTLSVRFEFQGSHVAA
ncbi:MAG: hypothetical protein KDA24_16635 [Deltaproteobacteria bacterium]|nr:hypothetical protein [Deltaproteobacteria bacterium]